MNADCIGIGDFTSRGSDHRSNFRDMVRLSWSATKSELHTSFGPVARGFWRVCSQTIRRRLGRARSPKPSAEGVAKSLIFLGRRRGPRPRTISDAYRQSGCRPPRSATGVMTGDADPSHTKLSSKKNARENPVENLRPAVSTRPFGQSCAGLAPSLKQFRKLLW